MWTQCRKIQVANSSDACCVSGQRRCWGAASWRSLGSQSCDVNGQAEFPPLLHREKSLVSMDRSMVCPQSDYSLTSRYTLVSQSISESLSLALRRAQAYSNHTDILHFLMAVLQPRLCQQTLLRWYDTRSVNMLRSP